MGWLDFLKSKPRKPLEPAAPEMKGPVSAGDTPPDPRIDAAAQALESGRTDEAIDAFRSILEQAPEDPETLLQVSALLGRADKLEEMIELVAPVFDPAVHGVLPGINLVQAYLGRKNPAGAGHLVDVLLPLAEGQSRERLLGFANAVRELLAEQTGGVRINLVTVAKPIWSYGIDTLPGLLTPPPPGRKRGVAFPVLAAVPPDRPGTKPDPRAIDLARGLPCMLAEFFYFSGNYEPRIVVPVRDDHGIFQPTEEWDVPHVRQCAQQAGTEYGITGAVRIDGDSVALSLRAWEAMKGRERKVFEVETDWGSFDEAFSKILETVAAYMEHRPAPGPAFPSAAREAAAARRASLETFLVQQGCYARSALPDPRELAEAAFVHAEHSPGELYPCAVLLGVARRLRDLGQPVDEERTRAAIEALPGEWRVLLARMI